MDEETTQKIQELQLLERNLQNFSMQKQAFQMEINETKNALEEIRNSSSDIYKMTGTIMIKADKEKTTLELEEKEKLLTMRISAIEKQESLVESNAESMRKDLEKDSEKKN